MMMRKPFLSLLGVFAFSFLVLLTGTGASDTDNGESLDDYRFALSVPASEFDQHNLKWKNDFWLIHLTAYEDKNENHYNTIWYKKKPDDGIASWLLWRNISEDAFQAHLTDVTSRGYYLYFLDGFSSNNSPRINCLFFKKRDPFTPGSWVSSHGQSSSEYQKTFDTNVAQGYKLDLVSSYQFNGNARYASIFSRPPDNKDAYLFNRGRPSLRSFWVAMHGITSSFYQSSNDTLVNERGYRLQYISGGMIQNGPPRFAALWVGFHASEPTPPATVTFHDVEDVQAKLDEYTAKGYAPDVIDAYKANSEGPVLWELILSKISTGPCDGYDGPIDEDEYAKCELRPDCRWKMYAKDGVCLEECQCVGGGGPGAGGDPHIKKFIKPVFCFCVFCVFVRKMRFWGDKKAEKFQF